MAIPGEGEPAAANVPAESQQGQRPVHATERIPGWLKAWRDAGCIALLLDFDGTLAPIVARPEMAELSPDTRRLLEQLRVRPDVHLAVVSGRSLADIRERVGITGIIYVGNHGMQIEGPGVSLLHPQAAAARPKLDQASRELRQLLADFQGAWLEDKGLTLSVHYRALPDQHVPALTAAVLERISAVSALRLGHGKKVLEVRPKVDWHKGRAVLHLLEKLHLPPGTPVLYYGDDISDEDAFVAIRDVYGESGEAILVADSPALTSAARAYLRSPAEVGQHLATLAVAAELPGAPATG